MTETDFSIKPTLTGQLVRLEPLTTAHVADMMPAFDDPELMRFTGTTTTFTQEQVEKIAATRITATDRLDLAVIDLADGRCVGEVVLNNWDPHNRGCSFRILLVATGRNRGLGTEAARMIVGHGFEKLGLHRIELGVFTFNPRAQRVYEKVGFVTEGVSRDALLWDGEWVDSVNMSILENEWATHRGHP